jgi:hypothetical protein
MLPTETASVWAVLEKEPSLAGAILIGGTALALRIGHRRSYDLDFCFPAARLPRHQIEMVIEALAAGGISAQRSDDPTAYDEFLNAGMSLHDFQQDFLNRLCSGRTAPDDPGFEAISGHPPTLDELRAYFISERDRYEIETAQTEVNLKRKAASPNKESSETE